MAYLLQRLLTEAAARAAAAAGGSVRRLPAQLPGAGRAE